MMTEPKLSRTHDLHTKNDGTGFDVESVLGRTDGAPLVLGVQDDAA